MTKLRTDSKFSPDEKSQIVTIILVLVFVTLLVSSCVYEGVAKIFTEIIGVKE
jgi:hypothetical protein